MVLWSFFKMRVSAVSMSKHFGMLGKMYGEHRFALAPNEQKAFKGFLDQAFVRFSNHTFGISGYTLYLKLLVLIFFMIGRRRETTKLEGRTQQTTLMTSKIPIDVPKLS
ncbi:hypothetical protein ANCCAN_01704 [Ancylostoma caninum]|uniref:Cytochrome b-c1 complex subunit 8 n=1 Tax=Ancylostoma caninum TaxID=29170 RepID=A0A368H6N6_ANCCA|nr:hypothetical protein ANCCAN_01704 [Ancylostoma caninum]